MSAYSELVEANGRRAAGARANGEATCRIDQIETWPGCAQCEQAIRREVPAPTGVRPVGAFRGCGCPDKVWRSLSGSWEVVA